VYNRQASETYRSPLSNAGAARNVHALLFGRGRVFPALRRDYKWGRPE
jgi:hypothetical protein